MTDDYNRCKAELREYFAGSQKSDGWLRVSSSSGHIYGKISSIGANFVYFKPHLIWEEANNIRKESCFRLEDKIESLLSIGSVYFIQPMDSKYIDSLLGKMDEVKRAGFGA